MKKILFILLLLAAIWWMWCCVYGHNKHIEADVTERTVKEFSNSKLSGLISDAGVKLEVDGRDVILTGVVSDFSEKATLLKTAHETYGVARVFDEITIAEAPLAPVVEAEPASPVTLEEPIVSAVPDKTCFVEIPAWMNAQNILFDSAKVTIQDESHTTINEMAQKLGDCPGVKILVEGHTDSDGSAELNQKLSADRAALVVRHLHAYGATQDITSKGYGESQPVATNATAAGKAQNRRVVFIITEKK